MWQIDYLHGQRQRQPGPQPSPLILAVPHLCLPQQEARCMAVNSEVQRKAGEKMREESKSTQNML